MNYLKKFQSEFKIIKTRKFTVQRNLCGWIQKINLVKLSTDFIFNLILEEFSNKLLKIILFNFYQKTLIFNFQFFFFFPGKIFFFPWKLIDKLKNGINASIVSQINNSNSQSAKRSLQSSGLLLKKENRYRAHNGSSMAINLFRPSI
jgi:hypothetical protein